MSVWRLHLQMRSRKEALALDCMCLRWTVTNIRTGAAAAIQPSGSQLQQPITPPAKGVLIHGFFLEGAAWEDGKGDVEGNLAQAFPKVLQYPMPVFLVEAIPSLEFDKTGTYSCPVYLTSARGPTYVTTANLRYAQPFRRSNETVIPVQRISSPKPSQRGITPGCNRRDSKLPPRGSEIPLYCMLQDGYR